MLASNTKTTLGTNNFLTTLKHGQGKFSSEHTSLLCQHITTHMSHITIVLHNNKVSHNNMPHTTIYITRYYMCRTIIWQFSHTHMSENSLIGLLSLLCVKLPLNRSHWSFLLFGFDTCGREKTHMCTSSAGLSRSQLTMQCIPKKVSL